MYLHQGALVHGMVWIYKYCKNLLLQHLHYFNRIWFTKCNTHIHSPKSLMPFCFSPNMWKLWVFSLHLSSTIGVSHNHGPKWRYCENLIHYHLTPHHLVHCMQYPHDCYFMYLHHGGKRRASLDKVGGMGNEYAIFSPITGDITTLWINRWRGSNKYESHAYWNLSLVICDVTTLVVLLSRYVNMQIGVDQ